MSYGMRHKARFVVFARAIAFALTLATVYGPMVGAALHNDGSRHAVAADDPDPSLHAAGCDHDELPARHDADSCLVCRILSQARTSALTRRAGLPHAASAEILPPAAAAVAPATVALTESAPRAPPSLL